MLLLRRFLYFTLVGITALLCVAYDASSQGHWIIWSALALSPIIVSDTYVKRVVSILLIGCALALTSFVANICAFYPALFVVYIAVVTLVCGVLSHRKNDYFYALIILNLFTLLSGLMPVTLMGAFDRASLIIVGTVIACMYQGVFYFRFVKSEMSESILVIIHYLQQLSADIFSCFLSPAYADNIYLFERRIHSQKNRCMRMLQYAWKMDKRTDDKKSLIECLERVFALLQMCSLLRFRVTDLTIFAVCQTEMAELNNEVDKNLQEMAAVYKQKNPFMNSQGLRNKIELFENCYQTVLQVTSKEPLVFLLFISSLTLLADEMEKYYELIVKNK